MKSGTRISKITFNDGSDVLLNSNSIVLLTGANNCGKSQSLKDIVFAHIGQNREAIVVKALEKTYIGDIELLINDIRNIQNVIGTKIRVQETANMTDEPKDAFKLLHRVLDSNNFVPKNLYDRYLLLLNTASRLIGFSSDDGRFYSEPEQQFNTKSIDLKKIYEDIDLEKEADAIISQSFSQGIVLNRASYNEVEFRYMERNLTSDRDDAGKPSFARWMESQPKLSQQGDGIVSFCNIVLAILLNERGLILIDEPESFLHLPQVRSLAHFIAEKTGDDVQLIISTHSHDFVQSLIDYGSHRTTVVRLERKYLSSGEINQVKRLDLIDISNLWKDPLLRTSDALTRVCQFVLEPYPACLM